ncbi:uncharacterized protein LOC124517709 [Lynx rufus]|uniref:uncharacterized protein LOC124517709 n=1 Tax=Lynx rufus TaxID=61384 RepID=UPI001F127F69|nr:uncharacterized protein LOC124517709 [Lynx rufus]
MPLKGIATLRGRCEAYFSVKQARVTARRLPSFARTVPELSSQVTRTHSPQRCCLQNLGPRGHARLRAGSSHRLQEGPWSGPKVCQAEASREEALGPCQGLSLPSADGGTCWGLAPALQARVLLRGSGSLRWLTSQQHVLPQQVHARPVGGILRIKVSPVLLRTSTILPENGWERRAQKRKHSRREAIQPGFAGGRHCLGERPLEPGAFAAATSVPPQRPHPRGAGTWRPLPSPAGDLAASSVTRGPRLEDDTEKQKAVPVPFRPSLVSKPPRPISAHAADRHGEPGLS